MHYALPTMHYVICTMYILCVIFKNLPAPICCFAVAFAVAFAVDFAVAFAVAEVAIFRAGSSCTLNHQQTYLKKTYDGYYYCKPSDMVLNYLGLHHAVYQDIV